jgi:outer membrane protein assembly factor BamB
VNGVPLTTPGTRDVLFVKLGPGLVFLGGNTIRSFGGAGDDEAHALAVAGDLVVVAGRYEGVMTFPESVPDLPDAGGEADAFVVALDTTTGEVAWGHGLQGDAGPGWAGAVAADRGGVVVAGAMRGTTDFAGDGSSPRGPADGLDAFVARYTAAGELAWVARIGGPGDQQASGAVVEGGFVYVAGRFDTVADFDPDTPGDSVPAGALEDVFLAKLGAAGELVWLTRYAVAGVGSDPRVAPGPVLAGSWRGQLDFRGTDGALSTTAEDAFVARFATR